MDFKSCHRTIRSRDSRCHMLPDLLPTLLILVEMWLVSVVIRPEDLLGWLHNVSVGNTDVVQYGATSNDLRREGWLHVDHGLTRKRQHFAIATAGHRATAANYKGGD
ncbi:hypothetical protein AAFF_G00177520 [Aldrovandia affinis]|uniref:Uncharacterized protein n=1 Tax=Aldrovandia affinis TaxID=143900 RepID=A0AAD7RKN2_9TELE|nr:hypothetical protein AAFF_G00177520 [Aldrovandia affinis]